MIYLDYAATTPVDKLVLKKMLPFLKGDFGNASSLHSAGQKARKAVEESRATIAKALYVEPQEIIFTSGATESNNLALKGIFNHLSKLSKFKKQKIHFITTNIEHHCVLDSMHYLEENHPKRLEVTYLPVNKEGRVDPQELKKSIKKNTALISIMYVNNEIGTVQPLNEIGQIIKKEKAKRGKYDLPLYFHADAAQALLYFSCDMQKLNLDLLTLSGHKIYGPKGVGILAARKNVLLEPILHGGGHERNRRSGTLNVPGIVGMGAAVKLAEKERTQNAKHAKKLRDLLIKGIKKNIPHVQLNGSLKERSPNNANFSFTGAEGESIVLLLDKAGIAVSTGSACSSENLAASHVQMALGNTHLRSHSSIRFSLGKHTTHEDIKKTVKELAAAVKELRKISQSIQYD